MNNNKKYVCVDCGFATNVKGKNCGCRSHMNNNQRYGGGIAL